MTEGGGQASLRAPMIWGTQCWNDSQQCHHAFSRTDVYARPFLDIELCDLAVFRDQRVPLTAHRHSKPEASKGPRACVNSPLPSANITIESFELRLSPCMHDECVIYRKTNDAVYAHFLDFVCVGDVAW